MSSTIGSLATAAHSAAVSLTTLSQIKPGDPVPSVTVKDENLNKITLNDVPGKILIVGSLLIECIHVIHYSLTHPQK
jgi:hypothetical protein